MNIKKLITKNADIYDGLFDLYDIDLRTCESLTDVIGALNTRIEQEEQRAERTERIHSVKAVEAERELSTLHLIKGFIDTMLYRETAQCEDDDFFQSVFDIADDKYKKIANMALPWAVRENFINLDIRNTDDLADNESEFDSLEYESFEDALDMLKSFDRR